MTDLKRERALIDELYAGDKGLFYWHEEDTRRIVKALAAAHREGAEEMRDECLIAIAEQRCERGTPWDMALQAALAAVRALPLP